MKSPILLMAVACLCVFAPVTSAQITNPLKKAEKKTNQSIDKGLNEVENLFKKKGTTDPEKTPTKDTVKPAVQEKPVQQDSVSLQTYSKFDFVPGEKVIFFDDFSSDNVGDFPAAWNTNGSGEVVTSNLFPGKWLRTAGRHCVWTDALLDLPDNYTIEFDVVPIQNTESGQQTMAGYTFRLMQCINVKSWDGGTVPGKAGFSYYTESTGRPGYHTYINGKEGEGMGLRGYLDNKATYQKLNQQFHISVWVQKSRIRLYQNETKMVDLPKAFAVPSVKMDRIRFEDGAVLITNVRIAVGAPDMRSKLITEGKLVSYGIHFDVNSAKIKPESYGTIKTIADVLKENPDVRIKIVGHTDSDGTDASNLDLSKRRAASVKNELINSFGIDAARMETDGKGESEPLAENNSVTNKAKNRRVEFIKL